VLVCALVAPAAAQAPKRPKAPATKPADKVADAPTPTPTPKPEKPGKSAEPPVVKKNGVKEQTFNLEGSNYSGKNRSPQLLYFLERANEELERASLEKRSFIPHLVRSLDQEAL
jgi:hypothetical protein